MAVSALHTIVFLCYQHHVGPTYIAHLLVRPEGNSSNDDGSSYLIASSDKSVGRGRRVVGKLKVLKEVILLFGKQILHSNGIGVDSMQPFVELSLMPGKIHYQDSLLDVLVAMYISGEAFIRDCATFKRMPPSLKNKLKQRLANVDAGLDHKCTVPMNCEFAVKHEAIYRSDPPNKILTVAEQKHSEVGSSVCSPDLQMRSRPASARSRAESVEGNKTAVSRKSMDLASTSHTFEGSEVENGDSETRPQSKQTGKMTPSSQEYHVDRSTESPNQGRLSTPKKGETPQPIDREAPSSPQNSNSSQLEQEMVNNEDEYTTQDPQSKEDGDGGTSDSDEIRDSHKEASGDDTDIVVNNQGEGVEREHEGEHGESDRVKGTDDSTNPPEEATSPFVEGGGGKEDVVDEKSDGGDDLAGGESESMHIAEAHIIERKEAEQKDTPVDATEMKISSDDGESQQEGKEEGAAVVEGSGKEDETVGNSQKESEESNDDDDQHGAELSESKVPSDLHIESVPLAQVETPRREGNNHAAEAKTATSAAPNSEKSEGIKPEAKESKETPNTEDKNKGKKSKSGGCTVS